MVARRCCRRRVEVGIARQARAACMAGVACTCAAKALTQRFREKHGQLLPAFEQAMHTDGLQDCVVERRHCCKEVHTTLNIPQEPSSSVHPHGQQQERHASEACTAGEKAGVARAAAREASQRTERSSRRGTPQAASSREMRIL